MVVVAVAAAAVVEVVAGVLKVVSLPSNSTGTAYCPTRKSNDSNLKADTHKGTCCRDKFQKQNHVMFTQWDM